MVKMGSMRSISLGLALAFGSAAQAETVLHIGDSLSTGTFGSAINEHLAAKGHKAFSYASCASSPFWWTTPAPPASARHYSTSCGYYEKTPGTQAVRLTRKQTPKLKRLMAMTKPDTVVVQLGTNLLTGTYSETFLRQEIVKLRDEVRSFSPSPRLVWVGPPDAANSKIPDARFTKFYEILNSVMRAPKEVVVKSWVQDEYPNALGDGLHFLTPSLKLKEKNWIGRVTTALDGFIPPNADAAGAGGHR
jgi:hypothetical protein